MNLFFFTISNYRRHPGPWETDGYQCTNILEYHKLILTALQVLGLYIYALLRFGFQLYMQKNKNKY